MSIRDSRVSRRSFLKAAGAFGLAPAIIPATAFGANERISVGVIGLGSQGFADMGGLIRYEDCVITAVCDVDREHYRDGPWGEGMSYGRKAAAERITKYYARKTPSGGYSGVDTHTDFRELCARDDIDAVVVATPDHWHALCTLEALRNSKDVYCEKPVTHLFREGQLVYQEAAKRNAIFQVGSQQRSERYFSEAVELVLNGHLGKIQRVEVGLPAGYAKPMGDPTVQDPPEHLDYEFWCGPSAVLPYMRARHHRWWRGHSAYGGGNIMDWIGHHNDIAHWGLGMDQSGPIRIEAVDWTYPETDIYNMPVDFTIACEYEGGITSTISSRNRGGAKWIGEDGWMWIDRGQLETSDPRWAEEDFDRGPIKAYDSPGHHRNFLDGVKFRTPCICPAETGHRSVTPGHLGFVSQAVGRPLQWDPVNETIVGDDAAQALLMQVDYRDPWSLEA